MDYDLGYQCGQAAFDTIQKDPAAQADPRAALLAAASACDRTARRFHVVDAKAFRKGVADGFTPNSP
jgi:hypothetical protein